MGCGESFWKVDILLLPIKIHNFLFFAALGCALPFRTVFAKEIGISATAVGVIFLAVPFLKILTNPLFGFLVDYFKQFRLTLSVLLAIVAATHVAMVSIPRVPVPEVHAQNLRLMVKYNCSRLSRSHIHVYAQLHTHNLDNLKNHSCGIKCNSSHLPSSHLEQSKIDCQVRFNIESHIVLKGDNCHSYLTLGQNSFTVSRNSSRNSMSVGLNYVDAHDKVSENCFIRSSNGSRFSNDNGENVPRWESLKSNLTTGSVGVGKFLTINMQSVFEVLSGNDHTQCSCPTWFTCAAENCNTSEASQQVNPRSEEEFLSPQFWGLFTLISVSSASFCAVLFLIDAVCYEMLSTNKEGFGMQRLWGTIGWGLGALAGGYLNQIVSTESSTNYSLSFYFLAVLCVIDMIPVCLLRVDDVKYSSHICKDVCSLLYRVDIAINVFIVFTIGVLSGLMWNYLFWFMEEIGSSQILLGLSQTFECFMAELPCFLISGWVIRKIGYVNCNSLTFLCFGLRYLILVYIKDPWMILPVSFLQGPTFGIFYASMTMYGKTEAPPGTEATVQSLLAMAFEGIGAGTGSILGGIGFDKFGSRATFMYAGILSFVLLGINILLHIFVLRQRNETPQETSLSTKEEVNSKF